MRTPLAWANLSHKRVRTAVVLLGVSFAILLVFMQLGFYGSCAASATLVTGMLDFDLVLVSPQYLSLRDSGSLARRRLRQAAAVDGVAATAGLRVGVAEWRNPENGDRQEVLVLGLDGPGQPFRMPEIRSGTPQLARLDTALVDRVAHRSLGPHAPGTQVEIARRRVDLVGDYSWGTGFNALGTVIVGESTFRALIGGASLDALQIGLVRVDEGADPAVVAARIHRLAAADVEALTRDQLVARERNYWLNVKPIGLMFTSGVLVAFLVGTVILYQVLYSDVARHQREYATLKAIGYGTRSIQGVVLRQGLLFGAIGFVPAAAAATLLYRLLRRTTNLPVEMTAGRLVFVLTLSLAMSGLAGLMAVRRVTHADPADLF